MLTSLVIVDNLSVNMSRNKSHDLSAPLYHARNLRVRGMFQFGKRAVRKSLFRHAKCLRRRKKGPVHSLLPRQGINKQKKLFSAERAEKLTQSEKGLYYNQDELLKQSSGQLSMESVSAPKSASHSKIHVEEQNNDEAGDTWQKATGKVQQSGDLSILPRKCQTPRKCRQ